VGIWFANDGSGVTFSGTVQAIAACWINSTLYSPGNIFSVSGVYLWSDSPYQAVQAVSVQPDGSMVYYAPASPIYDPRSRPIMIGSTGTRSS
jgi:hypothetical protein